MSTEEAAPLTMSLSCWHIMDPTDFPAKTHPMMPLIGLPQYSLEDCRARRGVFGWLHSATLPLDEAKAHTLDSWV